MQLLSYQPFSFVAAFALREQQPAPSPAGEVGIDRPQGLAALSNGEVVTTPPLYRNSEAVLATAKRCKKSRRTKAIHAKISNRREDFLHEPSAKIARESGLIVVLHAPPHIALSVVSFIR
jgi:transposase